MKIQNWIANLNPIRYLLYLKPNHVLVWKIVGFFFFLIECANPFFFVLCFDWFDYNFAVKRTAISICPSALQVFLSFFPYAFPLSSFYLFISFTTDSWVDKFLPGILSRSIINNLSHRVYAQTNKQIRPKRVDPCTLVLVIRIYGILCYALYIFNV